MYGRGGVFELVFSLGLRWFTMWLQCLMFRLWQAVTRQCCCIMMGSTSLVWLPANTDTHTTNTSALVLIIATVGRLQIDVLTLTAAQLTNSPRACAYMGLSRRKTVTLQQHSYVEKTVNSVTNKLQRQNQCSYRRISWPSTPCEPFSPILLCLSAR